MDGERETEEIQINSLDLKDLILKKSIKCLTSDFILCIIMMVFTYIFSKDILLK